MAEVLGIVSSIIAIYDATSKLVKYARSVKDAPAECQQFINELEQAQDILNRLQNKVEKEKSASESIKALQQPIENFGKLIKDLGKNLGFTFPTPAAIAGDSGPDSAGVNSSEVEADTRTFWRNAVWPFRKEEIDCVVAAIQRYMIYFNLALVDDIGKLVQELRRDHAESSARIEVAVAALASKTLPSGEEGLKIWQNEKTKQAIHWLSPLNFYAKHTDIFGNRAEGTGTWMLESAEFKEWLRGDRRNLLCVGPPGVGKSVLSSIIIDFLVKAIRNQDVAVCYIYCNYKEQGEQTAVNLLGSLFRQLATEHERLTPLVMKLYENCKKQDETRRPSVQEYTQMLSEIVPTFNKVYVVLDALDECSVNERDKFIFEMKRLPLQFLITSRRISSILGLFQADVPIEIRANDKDLEKYLRDQMEARSELALLAKNEALVEDIIRQITAQADGMFLLVHLYLASVAAQATPQKIREVLKSLPKGFDETYEKAMEHCASQSAEKYSLAKRILLWLVYATRPLSLQELQQALATQAGARVPEDLSRDDVLPPLDHMISVCAGLVTYEEESKCLKLVHYTTQEYFVRHHTLLSVDAHSEIAITCMNFMRIMNELVAEYLGKHSNSFIEVVRDIYVGTFYGPHIGDYFRSDYPFLLYSSMYWDYHARTGSTPELLKETNLFLRETKTLFQTICCSQNRRRFLRWRLVDCEPHLVASAFGLTRAVECQLEAGENMKSKNSLGQGALWLAATHGNADVLYLVLRARGYECAPPSAGIDSLALSTTTSWLHAARRMGKSLGFSPGTRRHQQINQGDKQGKTPLSVACKNKHWEVVKLLLSAGADCNGRSGRRDGADVDFPLLATSTHGNVEIVRLLLEKGARLEQRDTWSSNALMKAASAGHREMVQLLIEKGADIEAKTDIGTNAFLVAASGGHLEVVRLLLEKGANIDAKDFLGYNALVGAVERNHLEVVQLLIEKGIDIEATNKLDEDHHMLLETASRGHLEMVRLLLEKFGANIEAKDDLGENALMKAAYHNHVEVVRLLIEKGARCDSLDEKGNNLLHTFCIGYQIYRPYHASRGMADLFGPLMQLLLDNGVNPYLPNKESTTPKQIAEKGEFLDKFEAILGSR